jgi:hypothetical protein
MMAPAAIIGSRTGRRPGPVARVDPHTVLQQQRDDIGTSAESGPVQWCGPLLGLRCVEAVGRLGQEHRHTRHIPGVRRLPDAGGAVWARAPTTEPTSPVAGGTACHTRGTMVRTPPSPRSICVLRVRAAGSLVRRKPVIPIWISHLSDGSPSPWRGSMSSSSCSGLWTSGDDNGQCPMRHRSKPDRRETPWSVRRHPGDGQASIAQRKRPWANASTRQRGYSNRGRSVPLVTDSTAQSAAGGQHRGWRS